MSGDNTLRDAAGVIVTLEHRTTGERLTVARGGLVLDALRDALDGFDPAAMRVLAISTPRTILADLRGRPDTYIERRGRLLDGDDTVERRHVYTPEPVLLGRVGKLAYL